MKRAGIFFLLLVFLISGCASGLKRKSRKYHKRGSRRWHASQVGKLPSSKVPLVINEKVLAWINYFTGPSKARFGRYMKRSGKYTPMMKEILKRHNLPEELVYIAMIESGFSTHAKSHASAVGCWQFIRSTGKGYNLRIDSWVDERRDPVKATVAAAKYFTYLYKMFGHWYLAMAGYNAGEGKIGRGISRYGTKNFWRLSERGKGYIRAETREYVPKYIAATIIAKQPEKFGFDKVDYDEPLVFDRTIVDSPVDLNVAAKCAGTSVEQLKLLNPELRTDVTPPGRYELKVPVGKKKKFKVALAKIPRDKRVRTLTHVVGRRDTLYKIARRYGMSGNVILAANNLSSSRSIKRGRRLIIPRGQLRKQLEREVAANAKKVKKSRGRVVRYKIRRGDTLSSIARKFRVSVKHLRKLNGIYGRKRIIAGKTIKIRTKKGRRSASAETSKPARTSSVKRIATHKVASGDSLGSIANKYGTSVSSLKKLNPGVKPTRLKIGQKIKVAGSERVAKKTQPTNIASSGKGNGNVSIHKVARGENLGSIAQKYGTRVSKLKKMNPGLNPLRLKIGQKIKVSGRARVATKSTPAKVTPAKTTQTTKSAGSSYHVVESGQTLSHVARRYGMKIAELAKLNGMTTKSIVRVGKKLKVKRGKSGTTTVTKRTTTVKKPATASKKSGASFYTVKSGDNLWNISRKFKVSTDSLKKWNNLIGGKHIKPGQKLRVKR